MTNYPLVFPPSTKVAGQSGFVTDIDNLYNAVQALAGVNVTDSQWAGGADPTGAADSTAAFQAAINGAGAGVTFVPPGTYKVAGPLNPSTTSGGTLAGAGTASQLLWDGGAVATLVKMADTTQRAFHVRDLRITNTNASAVGTAIDASYFVYSDIERILIDGSTKSPNQGIIFNSGTTFYNWVKNCRVNVDGANAIGVRFDGGANNNHALGGRVFISASDATQVAYVVNAKSCSLYSPNCQGGAGVGIDVQSSGVACTVIDPYFENNAVANYRLASGTVAFSSIGGTVENDSAYSPNIVDNGAVLPFIANARTSHGGDQADTRGVIAAMPQPEDHGLIGWAYDPAAISNGSALTNGAAYFVKIPVRRAVSISKVWFAVTTATTVVVTSGQNFFGLYSATGTLLASGAADSVLTSTGPQSVSITPQVVPPGYVYACIMVNITSGTLQVGRNAGSPAIGNIGLSTSAWRFFNNTTGNTTALPASITLASNTLSNGAQDFWAAVS